MPLYEEKLVCPLSLRYTQDHIKTIFRDGKLLDDSLAQITTHAGVGDYDIILKAPFPHIEIIRVCPHRRGCAAEDEDEHWFTLDNRRLYCLQRAAVAHWPKRVAAEVEILYASPGSIRKKYDSSTSGRKVSVANSVKSQSASWWDWRDEVMLYDSEVVEGAAALARALIAKDDGKQQVSELMDVPAVGGTPAQSLLQRFGVPAAGAPSPAQSLLQRFGIAKDVESAARPNTPPTETDSTSGTITPHGARSDDTDGSITRGSSSEEASSAHSSLIESIFEGKQSGALQVRAKGLLQEPSVVDAFLTVLSSRLSRGSNGARVRVKDLDIAKNKISSAQFRNLFTILTNTGPSIERLRVFGCSSFDDEAMSALASWIQQIDSEEGLPSELHLSDCNITNNGFLSFMKAVERNDIIPRSDPRTGLPSPFYVRLENNYINVTSIPQKVQQRIVVSGAYQQRESRSAGQQSKGYHKRASKSRNGATSQHQEVS